MARDSVLLDTIVRLGLAAAENVSATEWLLAAIFVSLVGPMLVQVGKLVWTHGKRCAGRFLAFLWREFVEWLADRVFAWIMAAMIAFVTIWSGGFFG